MDPTKSNVNLPGINPYVKRQVWSYLTSKYPNLDRINLELIHTSVLLALTESVDYEKLYKSLQIEDEEQRLLIINNYLSSLVPKIINQLALKKNQKAQASIAQRVKSEVTGKKTLKFSANSILNAFKTTNPELPTSDSSYSESKSAYSQLLENKYKKELGKLGKPSATDPDFKIKTDRALEETNLFQGKILSNLEHNPKYKIFDPKTASFQDFKTSIINQRVSKLVSTGVIQPHGPKERSDILSSIFKGDFSFLEKLHISSPNFPTVREIIPQLTLLAENVKKTANGEINIPSDPLSEFNSYTDEITGNSDSNQVQSEERNTVSLRIALDLSTQSLGLRKPEDASLKDGVNAVNTVIGHSETLKSQNLKNTESNLEAKLGISKGEFSVDQKIETEMAPFSVPAKKNFFVTSDVLAGALSFAVNQSANSSKLSAEDRETLKSLQAQVLGVSGRMSLSFETQEELNQYLQSIRNLKSVELYKHFKKYTVFEAIPELDARLSDLQGILSLQHSNIHQQRLSKKSRDEQISLANMVGNRIFSRAGTVFHKLSEAKEIFEFLGKLKREGVIPALGLKKVDIFILASNAVGLKEVAELLEKYKRVKEYYHAFQYTRKVIQNFVFRNTARIVKVVSLLNPKKIGKGVLSATRRAVAASRSTYTYILFLQKDVRRTFSAILNRDSVRNFVSKSRDFRRFATSGLSSILATLKNRSSILFAKRIKDLEAYASSGKLFSGLASLSASSLKKFGTFLSTNISKFSQNFKKQLSNINFNSIKSLFQRSVGFFNSIAKSNVSKATQRAVYQVSRLVGQKLLITAARTSAKFVVGSLTAGLGFLAISAVEYIGLKRIIFVIASVVVAIIFIILYFVYLVISTISGSFNSSTSDTSREYNTSYTYGSVSGSGVSLSFLAGSLDSTDCAERVLSWDASRGYLGPNVWDNINKSRFTNLRVTTSNCRVICNMARAIAGLQPSGRGGVKGLNCNPNYYNGVIDEIGESVPFKYSGPKFGYYACNYLTYSAYNTRGSVVDPSLTAGYQAWSFRLLHDYCNSTPFESVPGAYGNQTIDELISNKMTNASCNSSFGDPLTRMRRWLMIPARVQGAGSASICIPRELINPGDVFYDGVASKGCLYGPNSMDDAIIHTGLVLEVTADKLYTLEANADVKTMTRTIEDCTARLNNQDVPGFTIKDGGRARYLCRFFKYNLPDPACPTDGSPYNCPEIISGTEGFMRD